MVPCSQRTVALSVYLSSWVPFSGNACWGDLFFHLLSSWASSLQSVLDFLPCFPGSSSQTAFYNKEENKTSQWPWIAHMSFVYSFLYMHIYSNKKDTSNFCGTISFDPVKMSQQNINQNVDQTPNTQKLVISWFLSSYLEELLNLKYK